jgi:alanine dehydrogenase
MDLSIDQGGCVATARPTTHSNPTYVDSGVIHYCVRNVPGQYPRTATRALAAAVAPRLRALALEPQSALLTGALNVSQGRVVHPEVEDALRGAEAERAA